VHHLGGRDHRAFCDIQDRDELLQGRDARVDRARLDPGDHGLADPGTSGKIRLRHRETLAHSPDLRGRRDMHLITQGNRDGLCLCFDQKSVLE